MFANIWRYALVVVYAIKTLRTWLSDNYLTVVPETELYQKSWLVFVLTSVSLQDNSLIHESKCLIIDNENCMWQYIRNFYFNILVPQLLIILHKAAQVIKNWKQQFLFPQFLSAMKVMKIYNYGNNRIVKVNLRNISWLRDSWEPWASLAIRWYNLYHQLLNIYIQHWRMFSKSSNVIKSLRISEICYFYYSCL